MCVSIMCMCENSERGERNRVGQKREKKNRAWPPSFRLFPATPSYICPTLFLSPLFSFFPHLYFRYSAYADFAIIYIEEAHPSDGWATGGNNPLIATHHCMGDRIAAATTLRDVGGVPSVCQVYVDYLDNAAEKAYGALFERLYILRGGRVVYQGGRGPTGYKINEVEAWLQKEFPSV